MKIEEKINQAHEMDKLAKKLKPCPFCGGSLDDFPGIMVFEQTQKKVEGEIGGDEYAVRCPHCSAQGSPSHFLDWAAEKWNRRER